MSNVGWTNEQRQAWAREHYRQHHGCADKNLPLQLDWNNLVAEANAESEAASAPTPTTPLPPRTPNGTLWAEPAIPPTPSPLNTPMTATAAKLINDETPWIRPAPAHTLSPPSTPATPQRPICHAPTPSTPTTPQYRRIQQLRQLRLIKRNRFKTKGKPAPPSSPNQPTAASQPNTPHTTSPQSPFNTSISPITHSTQYINSPLTPDISQITNSTMNESLNDTHMITTPTLIYDHSSFLNGTQSPRHIQYINGTYIYTSHH